jgi:tRNA(fMet)-specific endonuclease VapC
MGIMLSWIPIFAYISTITLAELEFGNKNANNLYKGKNRIALLDFLSIMSIK